MKKEDGTSSAPEKLEKEQEPAKNVKIEKVEDEDMQDGEDTEHVKVEADPEPTANAGMQKATEGAMDINGHIC